MAKVWKVTWVDPPHKNQQVSKVVLVPVEKVPVKKENKK